LNNKIRLDEATICVVGTGYVGLPLAKAFAKYFKVIGYDADITKVQQLNSHDNTKNLTITNNPQYIKQCDFIIIAVPTPVNKEKEPDLSYVTGATKTVSSHMKPGCTVILESTVYPGVTEEVVKPILEQSGLRCGFDFKLAYSPERVNPGDDEHTIETIVKVVSGIDSESTELAAQLYSKICPKIYKAKDIKTAEAAKVIENIQRDLNIALVNELSIIFSKMGLNILDILDTASTKWNFHRYSPGLVGGHCIPVDPYYLVHKAKEYGYYPQVILAGREINDSMPIYVAQMIIQGLKDLGKAFDKCKVLIIGLSYKENVADTRETPSIKIIHELQKHSIEVFGHDPLISDIEKQFNIKRAGSLKELTKMDGVIVAIAHKVFKGVSLEEIRQCCNDNPLLVDVRAVYDKQEATKLGFNYMTL